MPRPVIGPYPLHPPACEAYDPRAAEVADRVASLITQHLPDVTVEHVGSTSVPGCAGKGVVDLLVLYPEGELDAVKETLRTLGFQRQTHGHLHPETRPMRVGTLEHQGISFRLHVHVITRDSAEVAQLRAFRDWLRADPKRIAAYVALKREILDAGVTDPACYTGRKAAFICEALASAVGTAG